MLTYLYVVFVVVENEDCHFVVVLSILMFVMGACWSRYGLEIDYSLWAGV